MADDMGYGDVACNGKGAIPTPHMDRVAVEGVRFTDAHAPSSVCTPTRYGVLTGRYSWRSRLKEGLISGYCSPLIDPARLTVGSLLKQNGYATAAIGKWHVGMDWQTKPFQSLPRAGGGYNEEGIDFSRPVLKGPASLGFDRFFGISGSLNMPPFAFINQDRTVGIPNVYYNGKTGEQVEPSNPKKGLGVDGFDFENVDVRFCEEALSFMTDHHRKSPDTPFFLYFTPSAPHFPCLPPDFAKGKTGISARADLILVLDWIVGRFLATLEELGIADNTLLIVTSDNGAEFSSEEEQSFGHLANGGFRGFKSSIYDGGHREPLLMRWPDVIKPESVCNELVCLTDLMATVADINGINLPDFTGEDSISMLPLLRGEHKPVRDAVVHHSFKGRFAVRKGPWKLIESLDGGDFFTKEWQRPDRGEPAGQLYNMETDCLETENVYDKHPDIVRDLHNLLYQWQDSGYSRK